VQDRDCPAAVTENEIHIYALAKKLGSGGR